MASKPASLNYHAHLGTFIRVEQAKVKFLVNLLKLLIFCLKFSQLLDWLSNSFAPLENIFPPLEVPKLQSNRRHLSSPYVKEH